MYKINPVYIAEVEATGGRNGHVKSSDGIIDMDTTIPSKMGGPGGKTNPEQLFAAGYAACFGGAIGAIAKGRNVEGFTVTSKVGFGQGEDGGYGINAELSVHFPNLSIEEAQKVVDEAHQICPYSKATRGNIEVVVKAV